MGTKIRKSPHYALQPCPLQEITWIYYALVKALTRLVSRQFNNHKGKTYFCQYCLRGCTVKRYWKTIWKDASYTGLREPSSQKLTTRRGVTESNLQKQNTNYVYLLSSTWISKAFYVNKTRVSHQHHVPCGSCIYVKFNMGDTVNHPKWIWKMTLLKGFWTRS